MVVLKDTTQVFLFVCFTASKRKKNYMLEQYRQHMFSNLDQFEIALTDDPVK